MNVEELLSSGAGVASRAQFIQLMGRHAFDNAVKRRSLVAVFPRVYAYPWDVDLSDIRQRAALLSVGGSVALSHGTALALWGLTVSEDDPLHVTAYQPRHPRGVSDKLVVHRTRLPLEATELDELSAVGVERALVSSWPLQPDPQRRAPLIEACRRRLVSVPRLIHAAETAWWIRDIRSFRALVSLLVAGCESELELWGDTDVFDVPGLRDASRQRIVRVGGVTYRLDMAYDEQMLDVELDGRAFHASPDQWQRDIARDLARATAGWPTIRFPHRRLFGDVEGCRRDVPAVRDARRRRVG